MKKVFVVGYEAIEGKAGISGFNWFHEKPDADKVYNQLSVEDKETHIVYEGELEVVSATNDDITTEVDNFLHENDYENSFK